MRAYKSFSVTHVLPPSKVSLNDFALPRLVKVIFLGELNFTTGFDLNALPINGIVQMVAKNLLRVIT